VYTYVITEESLEEHKTGRREIKHLIYTAATIITETITKPGKTVNV
jgi:hypothetical protein